MGAGPGTCLSPDTVAWHSRAPHSWVQGAGLVVGHLQHRPPPQREAQVCAQGTHVNTHVHTSSDAHKRTHTRARGPEDWGLGATAAPRGHLASRKRPPSHCLALLQLHCGLALPELPSHASRSSRSSAVTHRMNGTFRLQEWKRMQVWGRQPGPGAQDSQSGEPTLLENREPSGPRSTRWAGGSRGAGAAPERRKQEQSSEALASLGQGHEPASAGLKGGEKLGKIRRT